MPKRLFFLLVIIVFISTCNRTVPASPILSETSAPIAATATGTPTTIPAFTPTNTLPPPEQAVSGFPYVAALNDALPKENLVLAQHFYADTVGHLDGMICYDVGIYSDGSYIFISCQPDFTYPAPNGTLDANQSRFLNHWMETFGSFEAPSIHGLLMFAGNGNAVPEYVDQVSMQALIGELDWDAHEYVHRGGYPFVVFHARDVLSHQLNKWLDNSNVFKFEAVDFPDSCLGAPKHDEVCEQVLTHGFYIQFVVDGMMYEFHTDVFGYDIRQFGEPQIAPTPGPVG